MTGEAAYELERLHKVQSVVQPFKKAAAPQSGPGASFTNSRAGYRQRNRKWRTLYAIQARRERVYAFYEQAAVSKMQINKYKYK